MPLHAKKPRKVPCIDTLGQHNMLQQNMQSVTLWEKKPEKL